MNDRVRILNPWQVWDDRGCFYVGLERTKQRFKGLPVYTDAFGRRFAIRGVS